MIDTPHRGSSPSITPWRAETILVVDDDEAFRAQVLRQLENAGFGTLQARDGSEAIHVFAERGTEIAAVLLDLVMPNTNGGETLAMLRSYAPSLPIVVTSGHSAFEALARSEAAPDIGFVGKPFTAAQLVAELRRVIDANRDTPGTPDRPARR